MDISGAGLYCAAKAAIDSQFTKTISWHIPRTDGMKFVGLSGTWHSELAPFGINTTSIQVSFQASCFIRGPSLTSVSLCLSSMIQQLGTFATSVATSDNIKVAAKHIPDYEGPHAWLKGFNSRSGKQAGDPYKAAERIITLLQGDRLLPKRLPLGVSFAGVMYGSRYSSD